MAEFDPAAVDPAVNKRLVQSTVTPRPIAWISTRDAAGVDNLAPFSAYNYFATGSRESTPAVHFNSPAVDGELKDTAENALATEEFAVNVVTEDLVEEMDETSADIPPGESEFEHADVTPAACEKIRPPRVEESPITMECVLLDTVEHYGKLMILGEVVHFHVADELLSDGKLQMENLVTVGRLGGPYYTAAYPMDFERGHR